jgi:dTDP-4-amino-4,6-dideoxygalactose transaminase
VLAGAVVSTPLPFVDLAAQQRRLKPAIDAAIAVVMAHGRFVNGPEVEQLEAALADRGGTARAVACSSGTDALYLVLLAEGVGPGDAVLLPAFTFAATAGAVALTGARPVLLDVLADTFELDAETISDGAAAARSAGLRPRAVIPVDLFGQPADHDEIAKQADAEDLWVLTDAAQSFGARLHGRPVGGMGRATTTSFFPSKPLGAYGDGGAILTDDDELAGLLVSVREHGRGDARYDIQRVGTTGRLDTLQAAVLLQKLTVFDDELARRQRVAERYHEALVDVVRTPELAVGRTSTWAQYTIRLPARDRVAGLLEAEGIPTAVHYPTPLHRQPAFVSLGLPVGDLATSDRLADEVLSLPMHPYLEPDDQDRIIDALRRASEAV